MKKTFLFLGIIALAFTVSACTNGVQNNTIGDVDINNSDNNEQATIDSGEYIVNADASNVEWFGERIVGNSHVGDIEIKSGSLNISDNKISSGEFVIDMTTISDSEASARLETHLRSDDFFSVNEYPEAKLVIKDSNIISSNSDEEVLLEVQADLTIKEITEPIEFITTLKKENNNLLANSELSIDRTKWDIKYDSGNFFQDLGDRAIKDEIFFDVNIVASE
ncbi:MAG: YceI family protein [Parcubacteria group bacterium]